MKNVLPGSESSPSCIWPEGTQRMIAKGFAAVWEQIIWKLKYYGAKTRVRADGNGTGVGDIARRVLEENFPYQAPLPTCERLEKYDRHSIKCTTFHDFV